MLPHIIPSPLRRRAARAHIPRPRDPLKVALPLDVLGVEEVDQRRHVIGHLDEVIVVQAEVVAADRGQIVRLRGVGEAVVLREQDALASQIIQARGRLDLGEVLQRDGQSVYEQRSHRDLVKCKEKGELGNYAPRSPARS